MVNPLTWLSRKRHSYEPLIRIELSKDRLLHNLHEFQKSAPNGTVAPVLKSNAYGHGLAEIARILKNENSIPFFVVDSYFEAIALRSHGVKHQILIIGYTRTETILKSNLSDLVFCISSLYSLKEISNSEYPISIHLKFDTGMRRQGFMINEMEKALEILSSNKMLRLEGICTHLSDADNEDDSFTESQINIWNNLARRMKKEFSEIQYVHAGATYGHKFTSNLVNNVSRLGLGLYGLSSFSGSKPVLSMKTVAVDVKKVTTGDSIGYNNTFKARKDMTIAVLPAGYFEGVDRRLSNCGNLLIAHGMILAPIVGRVSMNITTIDVTNINGVRVGSEIIVVSDDQKNPNSIINMAKLAGTIPYEIACHIPSHLKREII